MVPSLKNRETIGLMCLSSRDLREDGFGPAALLINLTKVRKKYNTSHSISPRDVSILTVYTNKTNKAKTPCTTFENEYQCGR